MRFHATTILPGNTRDPHERIRKSIGWLTVACLTNTATALVAVFLAVMK